LTKRALICGISGQDGAYLARLLLAKGYHVIGTSRDAQVSSFTNLIRLGIQDEVEVASMVLTDFRSTLQTLNNAMPDEIYNLAGQSSVALSFQQPVETMESVGLGVLNLLEALRFLGLPAHLYNSSSGECFGDTNGKPADEDTPFHPCSPYAVAKAAAHWMVVNYRDAYGLHASNGILFNHESALRPARFVTKKVVAGACAIKKGETKRLHLGNLDVSRDWGFAPEYVEAMWRMMQLERPTDLIIASGRTHTLQEFVAAAFVELGLDWRDHVEIDKSLLRPSDIRHSAGNPDKARRLIHWQAKSGMFEVVRTMVQAEMNDDQSL
jgi:GDPmannose 4,6-dehydratase